jgi:hypothetical protein
MVLGMVGVSGKGREFGDRNLLLDLGDCGTGYEFEGFVVVCRPVDLVIAEGHRAVERSPVLAARERLRWRPLLEWLRAVEA